MQLESRRLILACGAAVALALSAPLAATQAAAQTKTFRFANDGDASSMDPYFRNETFLLAFMQNIYEPLVRRNKQSKLEPALAVKWGQTSPTTWFFDLRKGVKFHDGTPFTADDVVFSIARGSGKGSNMQTYFSTVKAVRKVNDYRVEIDTNVPDPLLASKWAQILIMSKAWAEKNNAMTVGEEIKKEETYATRHAMGTGPFMLQSREPDVKTVLVRNPNWWDKPEHNLKEVVFSVIANAATRVAALRAGQIDMVYTVPPQDTAALAKDPNVKVIQGPETRVVYLGLDQFRDELLDSNIKGKNPFKDKRVREAIYRSIDVQAIKRVVMRGQSYPTALMVAPVINGYQKALDKRPSLLKPEQAKKLLADAGYPNGFEVGMNCPNDRYVNDAKICEAVVGMLARIGIKVNLAAETRSKFFARIQLPKAETSFFMLGWSPAATFDVHDVFVNLIQSYTPAQKKGQFNIARYSNKKFDELADKIQVETDVKKRDAMIAEATKIYTSDYAYIPLHQQALIWAARKNIDLVQTADNSFQLRWVKVK
ncbi:MAG: ABC transporter substrate-binding protein [Rhodospirillaceae bacterium]|nr:ABC transporter substrate-binding protein [Rhodospirillaceae bacterium]